MSFVGVLIERLGQRGGLRPRYRLENPGRSANRSRNCDYPSCGWIRHSAIAWMMKMWAQADASIWRNGSVSVFILLRLAASLFRHFRRPRGKRSSAAQSSFFCISNWQGLSGQLRCQVPAYVAGSPATLGRRWWLAFYFFPWNSSARRRALLSLDTMRLGNNFCPADLLM